MSSPLYLCTRVCACGEIKYTTRDEAGMHTWLEYNKTYRPGCWLFINGMYQPRTGQYALAASHVGEVQSWLFAYGPQVADEPGRRYFDFLESRTRYPDERVFRGRMPRELLNG